MKKVTARAVCEGAIVAAAHCFIDVYGDLCSCFQNAGNVCLRYTSRIFDDTARRIYICRFIYCVVAAYFYCDR